MSPILKLRERPVLALAYGAAGLTVALGFVQLVRTVYGSHHPAVGVVLAMPVLLECALIAAGLVLIGHAAPMRQGASHHCARCGYQRVEEIHRLLVNCPECGHAWRRFGGWRVGRAVGSRPKFILGVLICLAGLSGAALRGLASAWIAARMPTPMLLRHAVYAPSADTQHSWRALEARRLSLAQIRWAAQTLLDRRLATSVLDPAAAVWLGARLTDNSLDADLVDRYFDELVGLTLEAPERVFAGEAVSAAVYALPRVARTGTPLGEVTLIVGGIELTPPGPPAEDNRTDFEKQFLSETSRREPGPGEHAAPRGEASAQRARFGSLRRRAVPGHSDRVVHGVGARGASARRGGALVRGGRALERDGRQAGHPPHAVGRDRGSSGGQRGAGRAVSPPTIAPWIQSRPRRARCRRALRLPAPPRERPARSPVGRCASRAQRQTGRAPG